VDQDAIPGPAGLSLQEEIGAVMMVGFTGPLTDTVLADWRAHQFGGLLVVPINQNANGATSVRELIAGVRAVMRHPLLAATNQEGGSVCLAGSGVPCLEGARQAGGAGATVVQSDLESMSRGLHQLGFDVNFAPVADVWDGVHPVMADRSYGRDPGTVAADVQAAVAGIHRAGLLAAAKHFPGHGAADADSHLALPLVRLDENSLRADWAPFRAAVQAQVDFMMVAHLKVPALDSSRPSSMSAATVKAIRQDLGYSGVIISDDLEMGALSPAYPPPDAAVRFLANGGDMVIVSHRLDVADAVYTAIHDAVLSGRYPRGQLDASLRRILELYGRQPIP
jgi:beta-N-acetylhexosaminidase